MAQTPPKITSSVMLWKTGYTGSVTMEYLPIGDRFASPSRVVVEMRALLV